MFKPTKPGSIVEQVYHHISNAIMDGSIAPGVPLKERDMQDLFGVSRAPIREAIRLLEADRLVVAGAYRTKYVRQITKEDLLEVIPVLARLEGCAAFLSVKRLDPKQLEGICSINKNLKNAYAARQIEKCTQLNFAFHRYYVDSAENEALKQAISPIVKRVVSLWATNAYRYQPELFAVTIIEHDEVLQSFVDGDAPEAEKRVRSHVENTLDRVLNVSTFIPLDNLIGE